MKLILYKTVHHFFPGLLSFLRTLPEPRRKNAITYSLPTQFWVGVFLFLLKLGSRRQIDYAFNTEKFLKNLAVFTGQKLVRMLSNDTLAYFWMRSAETVLRQVRYWLINQLLRRKCLAKYRLEGYYLIAVDGTGHLVFKRRHCRYCLTKKQRGKVIYYHQVLDAKLVTANGFALSVETEFIENQPGARRQDCELKAFYRLVKRLAENYPQLRICLLLDALYANERVLDLCEQYNWRCLITCKRGSLPETYQEYQSLKKRSLDQTKEFDYKGEHQLCHWGLDLNYKFRDRHYINVLECLAINKKTLKKTRYLWLTNMSVSQDNIFYLVNQGGRLRWKTENEGFNMQKNGGYNLEHTYCHNLVAMKNFYLLMQIAHIINQLIEKGSLLSVEFKKLLGSIRNIAHWLLEDLRTSLFEPHEIETARTQRFQIRFDTS